MTLEQAKRWAVWGMRRCGYGECAVFEKDGEYTWDTLAMVGHRREVGLQPVWTTAGLPFRGEESGWTWEDAVREIMGIDGPL